MSPTLKERQEGRQEECHRGVEYSISFLHGQHGTIIMKNVNILVCMVKQSMY